MKAANRNTCIRARAGWLLLIFVIVGAAPAVAADSPEEAFRKAQKAINRDEYLKAAELFELAYEMDRQSRYAGDALYWQAFALHRLGGLERLRAAALALEVQQERYRRAGTHDDGAELLAAVRGELGRLGDARAYQQVVEQAETEPDAELEIKLATLQALCNMDSKRALPILRQIVTKRDTASAQLRVQALFMLAQHGGAGAAELLLDAAKEDPDPEVREQAIFWLGRAPSDEALVFITDTLRKSEDPRMVHRAVLALTELDGDRGVVILKDLARDQEVARQTREMAIMAIAHRHAESQVGFLQDLYPTVEEPGLKEVIIHAVGASENEQSGPWLSRIVLDENQPRESRLMALHWAGQKETFLLDDLMRIYESHPDREMREQVIFVLTQREGGESLEKLMQIARREEDLELRKFAIFFISQKDDPRVEEFLVDILTE